ncbi:MAG: exodeoxyribonuclease VII large subunit [Clostridia bacterium]|nr:exodeoxyribonuclease VII large subunit [Clostridia bacterium]
MNSSVLSVSQLNFYIKSKFDTDKNLSSVYLRGEISNLTDHYRSGHIYLSLKDEKAAIKAVMFASNASRLKFRLKDGMTVLVRGRVSVYETTGQYQFYIDDMQPDGIGALNLAFEQLKSKLSSEGLFDEEHKKPLPPYPKKIGVITSPTGAAVQDIFRILKRRYPLGEIVMCPVLVQGENAATQLTEAVERFNYLKCADVIIIGRGGGSIEDLWAFNDEKLARAVYNSEIPVVSAVGHETDFTICDFVADVRASTPSAAAELVSPEIDSMKSDILYYQKKLYSLITSKISFEKQRLEHLSKSKALSSPLEIVHNRNMKLDMLTARMKTAYMTTLSDKQRNFASLNAKLDALSPLKILSRGYSITEKDNKVIKSVNSVNVDDIITVRLFDGRLKCVISERKADKNEKNI